MVILRGGGKVMDIYAGELILIFDFLWILAVAGAFILGIIAIVKGWKKKKAIRFVVGFCACLIYVTFYPLATRYLGHQESKPKWSEEELRKAAEKRMEELKKGGWGVQSKTVGMTDATRKQIFWDLVELQDLFMKKLPYDNQQQQEAYKIIAKKYGVLESVVRDLAVRGVKEGWPLPSVK